MPFPDEPLSQRVEVVPYRSAWADEGASLAGRLREMLPGALSVQHIGSTSVPGLAAKDCLDMMVQVHDFGGDAAAVLEHHGYRRRPEPWNLQEVSFGTACRKQVFAPPAGCRPCNIHVREHGGANVRYALLFRDYLTADSQAADYGQIKAPAQEILMESALRRARDQGWRPQPS